MVSPMASSRFLTSSCMRALAAGEVLLRVPSAEGLPSSVVAWTPRSASSAASSPCALRGTGCRRRSSLDEGAKGPARRSPARATSGTSSSPRAALSASTRSNGLRKAGSCTLRSAGAGPRRRSTAAQSKPRAPASAAPRRSSCGRWLFGSRGRTWSSEASASLVSTVITLSAAAFTSPPGGPRAGRWSSRGRGTSAGLREARLRLEVVVAVGSPRPVA